MARNELVFQKKFVTSSKTPEKLLETRLFKVTFSKLQLFSLSKINKN